VRDKHVKTFASPELAKGIFGLYLGDKVRFCPSVMSIGRGIMVGWYTKSTRTVLQVV
jgi:hypothetical protein